ncbi:hypothetical protein [Streptomyces specialis]|uniref:hypothetical protein n=1 Tax=Streptomyces specialis TaxID=498367 RepID=UPI00073E1DC6|nr:hypothetical protein [Streptomyces specialis]
MTFTQWVPFATAAATVLAAAVAYAAARRTARMTWRSKTAEWQYESVIAFFDAALVLKEEPHTREASGQGLDTAWRRLELTGPEHLVPQAHPLYEAARELFATGRSLRAWNGLKQRAYEECAAVSERIDRAERAHRPVDELHKLHEEYNVAEPAYKYLREAVGPGSAADWEWVKKAADHYADMVAEQTDAAGIVTGRQIAATLAMHGEPRDLHEAQARARERLDKAVFDFTPQVRCWLDGKPQRTT